MSGESILHRMEEGGRKAPRVALRGSERASADGGERYELLGELARGGVGVVHRGHDNDLGRDVALKVLHEEHLANKELVQRFVEEAQIGGQLQHPGIVPVYELGLEAGERPFFAMKLVKGETLAKRLADREDPADERRALLTVFRDVCRTMSYAHARGVIHRDLKPSNVMIGGFGEVQVVDWGLAKVLSRGGVADERLKKKAARDVTMVATVRSGEGSSHSVTGSVMGTPAYMPPEQALGRVEDLDERSDVFSLGAILCEILTGAPPYAGDHTTVLTAAAGAQQDDARKALDACDADERLVALCRRCLEPLPKNRPSSVEQLADEIASWLADAESQAHRAELAKVEAEAEAEEQRRARRQTRLVAGGAVGVVSIAVALFLFASQGRAERERERQTAIDTALEDATRLRAAGSWDEALAAAERAIALGADDALLEEIHAEATAAAEAERIVAEDLAFLAELEEIRGQHGQVMVVAGVAAEDGPLLGDDHHIRFEDTEHVVQDNAATETAYGEAFLSRFGSVAASVERLAASEEAEAFAAILGHWAWLRRVPLERADWQELEEAARDVDPGHADLRAALVRGELAELKGMVESYGDELPPALAAELGNALVDADAPQAAQEFLARVAQRAPDDFDVHVRLGRAAYKAEAYDDATRHYTAALALRPGHTGVWLGLGWSLQSASDHAGALAAADRWISVDPSPAKAHNLRGLALCELGEVDDGIAAFRRAAELDPDLVYVHTNLGRWFAAKGDAEASIEAYSRALEVDPEHMVARFKLILVLVHSDHADEALAMAREAVQEVPDDPITHHALGHVLWDLEDLPGASTSYRRALELDPADPNYLLILATLRSELGDHEEALDLARRAREVLPEDARSRSPFFERIGMLQETAGDRQAAVASYGRAAQLDGGRTTAWRELARLHYLGGDYAMSAEAARRVIDLEPDHAMAHNDLGRALYALDDHRGALTAFERAAELAPEEATYVNNVGIARGEHLDDYQGAAEAFRRVLELDGDRPGVVHALADMLYKLDDFDGAAALYRRVLEQGVDEELASSAYNMLGHCLEQLGDLEGAVAETRKAVALNADQGGHGSCLARMERKLESLRKFERMESGEVVEIAPEDLSNVGRVLYGRGEHERRAALFLEFLERHPGHADHENQNRWSAICSAALTGDERWHPQILAWLKEEVAMYRALVDSDPAIVARRMRWFQNDPDVTSIRDHDELPPSFAEVWAEVDALLEEVSR